MSYLREYIRYCLFEEGNHAYGQYPVSYNPEEVLYESNNMKIGFDDLVHENMDLAYFHKNFDNELDGAAWIGDNGIKFEFVVITNEYSLNHVFENLVRDCMEEYATLRSCNHKLQLEIKVEDEETEKHLSDVYGLSVLSQNENIAIMGFAE